MEAYWIVLGVLGVVLLSLGAGLWIFSGLTVTGLVAFYFFLDFPIDRIGAIAKPIMMKGVISFELAAVPLFIWMGEIISCTNLSSKLFRGLAPWVSRLPGGLLHANVFGSVMFSALSGSSVATTATIGRVTTRELTQRGYDTNLVLGSITVAGTIGIMIPPSITLIVYGLIAEVSVARLFAAGVFPGIMLGALYSGYIAARSATSTQLAPAQAEAFTWRDRFRGLVDLLPTVLLILFLLGSIYGGYATPSESAAVGVLGAIVIAYFSGGISFRDLYRSAMSAVVITSMIGSAIAGAALMASAIGFLHMPQLVSQGIAAMQLSPLMLLLALTVVYLILGCVMDGISMILMTVPITLPLLLSNGFDPVWVGVYLVLMVEVGMVTPPIGFNLFVLRAITGIPIGRIAKATMPFFFLMLLGGVLLTIFPGIALWLPSTIQ